MGWYSQGTQVIDFTENRDGTLDFKEAGWFIPSNANEWVSAVFKVQPNKDGTFTYYGATGDFSLGEAGRTLERSLDGRAVGRDGRRLLGRRERENDRTVE